MSPGIYTADPLIGDAVLPIPAPRGHDLDKTPTGIRGLDDITRGGLPAGRPTSFAAVQDPARRCWP